MASSVTAWRAALARQPAARTAAAYAAGRWMRRRKPALATRISPGDAMYEGLNALSYFAVGADALSLIRQSLLLAGTGEPQAVLDLPCGHGRVLRWMKAEWPAARLVACDLDRSAVDWCERAYGAEGVYSCEYLEDLDLPGPFDVVWVGSLLTHLDRDRWVPTLTALASSLRPGGCLVFTTHGQEHRERLSRGAYVMDAASRAALLDGWEGDGFGYAAYPDQSTYGISLSAPAWVRATADSVPGLEHLATWIAGWNHHQDAYAYRWSGT